jgi:hypothetical protein
MSHNDKDRVDVEQAIHSTINWALTKDFERLFSSVAQDEDFFIFHPDSKSTIIGFEAFKQLGERSWMTDAFKATDFAQMTVTNEIKVLRETGDGAIKPDLQDNGELSRVPGSARARRPRPGPN